MGCIGSSTYLQILRQFRLSKKDLHPLAFPAYPFGALRPTLFQRTPTRSFQWGLFWERFALSLPESEFGSRLITMSATEEGASPVGFPESSGGLPPRQAARIWIATPAEDGGIPQADALVRDDDAVGPPALVGDDGLEPGAGEDDDESEEEEEDENSLDDKKQLRDLPHLTLAGD